jgi:hypothetical protein
VPTSIRWVCPTELTADERRVAQTLHRIGKCYVFLREVRTELFDEAFQAELATVYQPRGTAPVPPALLAMVTLLQAYDQVGDADAVVTARMDKRWQLVLDCLGTGEAPFSQGVLVRFRERMIAHNLDQKLLARTIELAKRTGKCGWQHLPDGGHSARPRDGAVCRGHVSGLPAAGRLHDRRGGPLHLPASTGRVPARAAREAAHTRRASGSASPHDGRTLLSAT